MDEYHLSSLLMVGLVSLLAAISPGPDFVVVARNSLAYSRKAGFMTALGISFGLLIHLTYTLVGLAVLIIESPMTYNILKYSGAAYLGYLGITTVISSFKNIASLDITCKTVPTEVSPWTMVRQGFLTNLLNPKCAVFFVSLFSQFITPETSIALRLEYGVVNWAVTLTWFLFLSYILSGELLTSRIDRFRIYIDRVMGSMLVLLSLKLLFI